MPADPVEPLSCAVPVVSIWVDPDWFEDELEPYTLGVNVMAAPGPDKDAVEKVTVMAEPPFPATVIKGALAFDCALRAEGVVPAIMLPKLKEPDDDTVKPWMTVALTGTPVLAEVCANDVPTIPSTIVNVSTDFFKTELVVQNVFPS